MIIILIAVFLKLILNPSKLISQQQAQIKLEQDCQNDQPGRAVIYYGCCKGTDLTHEWCKLRYQFKVIITKYWS